MSRSRAGFRGSALETSSGPLAGSAGVGVQTTIAPVYYGIAALSLAAALVHLWVVPEHLQEWWAYGVFFGACALAQGIFAVTLLRWPSSTPLVLAGILGNLLIVVLFIVSSTWGVPLGPDWVLFSVEMAHAEETGVLGMGATVAEVLMIFGLVSVLRGACRRWVMNGLLLAGGTLWALRFMGILP